MSLPRLLLVDDDASIRRMVAMALESEPLCVVPAASLAEAAQALQTSSFSVVMCDLVLPDGSGHDLLQWLGQPGSESAAASRVVFSAGVSEAARALLLRQGVFRVLSKPVGVLELVSCARQALLAAAPSAASSAAAGEWVGAGHPAAAPSTSSPIPRTPAALLMPAAGAASQPGAGPENASAPEIAHAVAHYFAGDFKRYVEFDRRCRTQFGADILLGEQALYGADLAALHRLAHSLKSVLLCLGQGAVSDLAARLESKAGAAQLPECTALWTQLVNWLRTQATA